MLRRGPYSYGRAVLPPSFFSFMATHWPIARQPSASSSRSPVRLMCRRAAPQPGWPARLDTRLCEGDTIRVGRRSRAAVTLINDAVLRIDQNTTMRLIDITPEEEESSLLDLFSGAFQSFSRKPKYLKVNTPYLNGSVEGTEFVVRVLDDAAVITVFEGVVLAANEQGQVAVNAGESARAAKGQAPQRRTLVKPRDRCSGHCSTRRSFPPGLMQRVHRRSHEAANCAANGNTRLRLCRARRGARRCAGCAVLRRAGGHTVVGRSSRCRA